jgi:hypothetical protein
MLLLLATIFAGWRWWGEAQARQEAERLLEEAARSDRVVAQEELIAGEAPAALAHLVRAIRYEPVSMLAPEIAVASINDWRFPMLMAILEGHAGPVHSAQFSPDGKRIVTASDDDTARLWERFSKSGTYCCTQRKNGGVGQGNAPFGHHLDQVTGA